MNFKINCKLDCCIYLIFLIKGYWKECLCLILINFNINIYGWFVILVLLLFVFRDVIFRIYIYKIVM